MATNFELGTWKKRAPGLALCMALTLLAYGLGAIQERAFDDFVPLEPLVAALLLGLAVRALFPRNKRVEAGTGFAAKQLLEFAIVLLGATLNLRAIADAGTHLVLAVLTSVSLTLLAGIGLGRLAGLGTKQSILIAVGNAICGNSAIAAVAPVIRAKKQEIASAIALTAVLGVGVVLLLPLLVPLLDLSNERYGALAGLTVYAVPQVLAATLSVSPESGQVGSLVKLTRVLLLGPVVALFAWLFRERGDDGESTSAGFSLSRFVPWFVLGFGILTVLRTTGLVPDGVARDIKEASTLLTAIAMAGLGLGVDIRTVKASGPRVGLVVIALTILLVVTAVTLVTTLDIG